MCLYRQLHVIDFHDKISNKKIDTAQKILYPRSLYFYVNKDIKSINAIMFII